MSKNKKKNSPRPVKAVGGLLPDFQPTLDKVQTTLDKINGVVDTLLPPLTAALKALTDNGLDLHIVISKPIFQEEKPDVQDSQKKGS